MIVAATVRARGTGTRIDGEGSSEGSSESEVLQFVEMRRRKKVRVRECKQEGALEN